MTVSVDQVGADVGTRVMSRTSTCPGCVRRSGWCRRRHRSHNQWVDDNFKCPSIRLVPTSAPLAATAHMVLCRCVRRSGWCRRRHLKSHAAMHSSIQCPSIRLVPTSAPEGGETDELSTLCPSIRLVPTSAPERRDRRRDLTSCVRRSGWCRRRHRFSRNVFLTSIDVSVDQVGADVGTRSSK